jgi:hypothetical protein
MRKKMSRININVCLALLAISICACLPTRFSGRNADLSFQGDTSNSVLFGSVCFYEGSIKTFTLTMVDSLNEKKKYNFNVKIKAVGSNYFHQYFPPGDYILKSWSLLGVRDNKEFRATGSFGKLSKKIIRVNPRTIVYLGRIVVSQIGVRIFLTVEENAEQDFDWLKKTFIGSPWLNAEVNYPVKKPKKKFSARELQNEALSLMGESSGDSPQAVTDTITPQDKPVESVPFSAPEGLFELP